MNTNNNISIWRGSNTPPTKFHLWLKNNKLYHFDGIDWIENKVETASYENDGLMSKEDKERLDNLVYDGLDSTDIDKALSANLGNILLNKINDLKISAYKVKGSVENFDNLPTENLEIGDVYNILNSFYIDNKKYPEGTNVVWTGSKWDPLGGTVDFKNYSTTEEINEIITTLENNVNSSLDNVNNSLNNINDSLDNLNNTKADKVYTDLLLETKVDKVQGKELSTNDYTTAEKTKLAGVETGANKTVVDTTLSTTSTNPVQNKVVSAKLDTKVDKVTGKGLSTNDYTNAEKNLVTTIPDKADKTYVDTQLETKANIGYVNTQVEILNTVLETKVNKVTGKSLILDSEIEKLAGLPNSTELTNSIANAKAAGDNAQSDLDAHKLNVSNPHLVTKAQLGLGNVTNDSQVKRSEMGVAGGVAILDGTGKVPAALLPVYVDDVLEGTLINATTFQLAEGQQGGVQLPNVIYVDTTTNKSYRWSGTQYVTIASDLALGETSSTAYPGNKGKAATDNINKVKSTSLSHIDDTTPVTYSASKVTVNYECYEGDQYGSAGTKHGADIAAASETVAGVMTAADKSKLNAIEAGALVNTVTGVKGNSESSYRTGNINITPTNIGLENVDNTSDLNKPVSTAQQTALDKKVDKVTGYGLSKNNFTDILKNKLDGIAEGAQVNSITGVKGSSELTYRTGNVSISASNIGLGNVNNTSDVDKPISTAQLVALDEKVDKVSGKGLSTNDYTTEEKNLVATIPSKASKEYVDKNIEQIEANLTNVFIGLEEILAYGVEWDTKVADPHLTRIGNMSLHKTLPIQSQLKGCIAQKDKVIYWLNENDWRFKKDPETVSIGLTVDGGYSLVSDIFSTLRYEKQWVKIGGVACQINSINTDTNTAILVANDQLNALGLVTGTKNVELGAVLNGYDGTVRVYCPNFYIKSIIDGTKRRVWISTVKIDNSYTYQHEILVDAYRSTVLNTVPTNMGYLSTLPVNSAISVVNEHTYCRGGGNRSANDMYIVSDPSRTDLCKPRTNLSRATMRTYSRNAGSEMLNYDLYKNIFYWLYVIEYANFNCQEAYNEALTDEGYKQGGLGAGVTIINGTYWSYYNNFYPLTPCGYCNELGNGTGLKTMIVVTPTTSNGDSTLTYNFSVPRWRGFDNTFGDIWTNLDGIIIQGDAEGNPKTVYTTTDPNNYGDNEAAKNAMEIAGHEIHYDGYIKEFDLGEAAHIIPESVGGNTTKYKCDYHWTGSKNTSLRTLIVGGLAHNGATAGLGYFNSYYGVSDSGAHVGFRSVSTFVSFSE